MAQPPDMSVDLAGVKLDRPIVLASGTCGYIDEFDRVVPWSAVGAVTTKSITRESRDGNPPWRIIGGRDGMLNAIGLANAGVERFIADHLPRAERIDPLVIGSIAGGSVEDYVAVAERFEKSGLLRIVELNVSCPNTSDGLHFGQHPDLLRDLVAAVRRPLESTKLLVKLSPDVGDIVEMARAAVDAGADGLTLINTVSALAIDVETRQPRLSRGAGGLSGPSIHPLAVRMVHDVYEAVARDASVPIIGLGGVLNWRDAAEFILAGASAVGMGTALFVDPRSPRRVLRGLSRWVERQGMSSLRDLVGRVEM